MQTLGEYLKMVRELKKLSLREADRLTGVSAQLISNIENGKRTGKPETLRKIAEGYNVDYLKLAQLAGYISKDDLEIVSANDEMRQFLINFAQEAAFEDIKKAAEIIRLFKEGKL